MGATIHSVQKYFYHSPFAENAVRQSAAWSSEGNLKDFMESQRICHHHPWSFTAICLYNQRQHCSTMLLPFSFLFSVYGFFFCVLFSFCSDWVRKAIVKVHGWLLCKLVEKQ